MPKPSESRSVAFRYSNRLSGYAHAARAGRGTCRSSLNRVMLDADCRTRQAYCYFGKWNDSLPGRTRFTKITALMGKQMEVAPLRAA